MSATTRSPIGSHAPEQNARYGAVAPGYPGDPAESGPTGGAERPAIYLLTQSPPLPVVRIDRSNRGTCDRADSGSRVFERRLEFYIAAAAPHK